MRSFLRSATVCAAVAGSVCALAGHPPAVASELVSPRAAVSPQTHSVVRRYVAGSHSYHDASRRLWRPDSTLRAGGTLVRLPLKHRNSTSALYRLARVGVSSYRVPVGRAGSYVIRMHYATCRPSRCARQQRKIIATTKSATLRVSVPGGLQRTGVTSLVIARSSQTAVKQPPGVFGASSIWQQHVAQAPVSPASPAMIDNLVAQVHRFYGGTAAFNAYQYNVSWYAVSASQSVSTVQFSNCQHKPKTPPRLYGSGGQFVDVPIPASAVPAVGTDATLSIYRPSTDQLWELWKAYQDASGTWYACWGGRLDNVSTNPGYWTNGFGSSATGIAGEGGDVTIKDVKGGSINHALSLAIPAPAHWKNYVWPAHRSDGGSMDPAAIPEGTRLRLDPRVNVSALGLSPIATMVATAAQRYGFVVTNRSGCVAITAESGLPTDAVSGVNPWDQLLGGLKPYQVLKNFPWDRLEAIDPAYNRPANAKK